MPRTRHLPGVDTSLPSTLATGSGKGFQLRDILEHLVTEFGPGRLLPSERVLADQYAVARGTVRQAIDRLVNDGLAYRRPGRGTYTAQRPTEHVDMLSSFSRDMRARGLRPGSQVLTAVVEPANPRLAARLQLAPGEPLFRLERLRLADDRPMALERTNLPLDRFPGIDELDWANLSMYEELERRWGIVITRNSTSITAMLPEPEDAALLGIPDTQPCLVVEGTSWDRDSGPVEAERSMYRGDRYDIVTDARQRPTP